MQPLAGVILLGGPNFIVIGEKDQAATGIKAAKKALGAAVTAGDIEAALEHYTRTAKVLPADAPVLKGRKAIGRFWQGTIGMGVKRVQFRMVDLDVYGTTANELCFYTVKDSNGNRIEVGKYVIVWKNENGAWKLHWDIFNTDGPAARP